MPGRTSLRPNGSPELSNRSLIANYLCLRANCSKLAAPSGIAGALASRIENSIQAMSRITRIGDALPTQNSSQIPLASSPRQATILHANLGAIAAYFGTVSASQRSSSQEKP
jgi:hypothetical protein